MCVELRLSISKDGYGAGNSCSRLGLILHWGKIPFPNGDGDKDMDDIQSLEWGWGKILPIPFPLTCSEKNLRPHPNEFIYEAKFLKTKLYG